MWLASARSLLGRLDGAYLVNTMAGTPNMSRLILEAGWVSLEIDQEDLPEIRL